VATAAAGTPAGPAATISTREDTLTGRWSAHTYREVPLNFCTGKCSPAAFIQLSRLVSEPLQYNLVLYAGFWAFL
jgi:hypothetical protein